MASDLEESRTTIAVRIHPLAVAAIDAVAVRDDRTRSDTVRRMLAYALRHMPAGWRPAEVTPIASSLPAELDW